MLPRPVGGSPWLFSPSSVTYFLSYAPLILFKEEPGSSFPSPLAPHPC